MARERKRRGGSEAPQDASTEATATVEGNSEETQEESQEGVSEMVAEATATKERPTYNPEFAPAEVVPAQTRDSKSAQMIQAFLESGIPTAQVSGHSKTFHLSLKRYIERAHLEDKVEVITREGGERLYLRNKSASPAPVSGEGSEGSGEGSSEEL